MPSTAIWIGLGIREARRWETEMLEAATNPDAVPDAVEQRKTDDAKSSGTKGTRKPGQTVLT